jgi:hypothetical protein
LNLKKYLMKKINLILLACLMGVVAQAQIIDPLTGRNSPAPPSGTGSLIGYTPYMVLDNSLGTGLGLIFPSSASGLSDSFLGTAANTAEQALFLSPANTFITTFAVGQRLTVNVAAPTRTVNNSLTEDFGLAIAAATPIAAGSGNSYNSRTLFDWASISVRPIQQSIRANSSISGILVTSANVLSGVPSANVSQLYIDWVSADVFTMGYIDTSAVQHVSETITFAGTSTIGTEIGFYGDLRVAGQSIGSFTDLAISPIPVPEPTSFALCGLGGLLGLVGWMRRKK